jgi:hypothetical protein
MITINVSKNEARSNGSYFHFGGRYSPKQLNTTKMLFCINLH